jgi:hypothetical protein
MATLFITDKSIIEFDMLMFPPSWVITTCYLSSKMQLFAVTHLYGEKYGKKSAFSVASSYVAS